MGSKRKTKYLPDDERYRLLFGPYGPPVAKHGYLIDVVRGKLQFSHFSQGRIPWPIAKRRGPAGSGGFIFCGDLVRALNFESGPAIAYHWGVCSESVRKWKAAIGAPAMTTGAKRLSALGRDLAKLPEVRSRMSKSARKRPVRKSLKRVLIEGARKRHEAAAEARRGAYRRSAKFPRVTGNKAPWIPEEERFLGKETVDELVELLGRTAEAIIARHSFRKIPIKLPADHPHWAPDQIKLLGTAPDSGVAATVGRSVLAVQAMRRRKRLVRGGFRFAKQAQRPWTKKELSLLGHYPDRFVARKVGRTLFAVMSARERSGIKRRTTPINRSKQRKLTANR
jgi:hypothetical protein